MPTASDHLLRTMASIPVESRVLDLECGEGRYTVPLLRLGFDVYACDHVEQHVAEARERIEEAADGEVQRVTLARPHALGYPDAFFDWVVTMRLLQEGSSWDELLEALEEARRVLAPGGWLYVLAPAVVPGAHPNEEAAGYAGDSGLAPAFTPETLESLAHEAGFVTAEAPASVDESDVPQLHAIYRRVEEGVAP